MKERYYKHFEFYVVISVMFALAFQTIFDSQIQNIQYLKNNEALSYAISFLSSIGIFFLFFSGLLHLYRMYLWKIFDRRYNIDGQWNATITKSKGQPHILYGIVNIEQTFDNIHFSAKHYKDPAKKETWSHWDSTNVFFNNGNIEVFWEVKRMGGEVVTGKITFKTDGNKPPRVLDGIFIDNAPSDSFGHMHYERI